MKFKKSVAVATTVAFAFACVGCAPRSPQDKGASEVSEGGVSTTIDYKELFQTDPPGSWEAYAEVFPDQVLSFYEGKNEWEWVKDQNASMYQSRAHSHASIYRDERAELTSSEYWGTDRTNIQPNAQTTEGSRNCLGCKTSDFTEEVEENGLSVLYDEWTEDVDWWDCGLCHEGGTPGAELKPGGFIAAAYGEHSENFSSAPVEDQICGQCHSITSSSYGRGAVIDNALEAGGSLDDLSGIDPWKYGFDPDGLAKAALENGTGAKYTDEELGLSFYIESHPEFEVFQESEMSNMGITCVDCHMHEETNENGETFTSHNASGNPLQSEATLQWCITCHEGQSGVSTTEEMKDFTLDVMDEIAGKSIAVGEKLDELKANMQQAVRTGTASEDVMEIARENFSKAYWYRIYVESGGNKGVVEYPGMKSVHNPEGCRKYLEIADELLDEANALFA